MTTKQVPLNTKFDAQITTITRILIRIGDDLHEFTYEQACTLFRTLGIALLSKIKESDLTPILMAVSREFGLPQEVILSKDRRENVARARQTGMYLARELTNLSLQEIATFFGDCDHGTSLHAHRRIAELIEAYPSWKSQIKRLKLELQISAPNTSPDAPLGLLPRK